MPAILFIFLLLGSAQAVDADSELILENRGTPDPMTLKGEPYIPDAPTDLVVDVSCQDKVDIAWKYNYPNADGFMLALCPDPDLPCQNTTLDAVERKHTVQLLKRDAEYIIFLSAYLDLIDERQFSKPAITHFSSYPEVPDIKSLSLTALNSSSIQATWTEEWVHKIQFSVCTTPTKCHERIVLGNLGQLTFTGLAPDTAYTILAQAQVTRNNKTCRGARQNRTAQTFPMPPGPVSNLKYKIVNSVFLNALWDAPSDTPRVDGYTIECREVGGSYYVGGNVLEPKTSLNVTEALRKFAKTFNCSVLAFINSTHHGRINGTRTVFEVSTQQLDPPKFLNVTVLCENQASVTWDYELSFLITGFVAKLCSMNESHCENRTLPASDPEVSYRLQEYGTLYNLSVVAYVKDHLQTVYSRPTTATFFSFPKLPELDDVSVSPLNTTALRATWKDKWGHQIEFNVCTTPHDCQRHTVFGSLLGYTFTGLLPDTEYNVSAQAEVTLNNKTCKGPQQSRSASTFAEAPGNVTGLKHTIKNGIILIASWNSPKEVKTVKGYTISCVDSKTMKNVTKDVESLLPLVNVSLNLHEPVGEFYCAVWAYNKDNKGQRVPGPKSTFEVTTDGIVPPRNVTLLERTATSLTYTWIADPTAPGWNITPADKGELEYGAIGGYGETDNRTVTHNITNLEPWTTYNMSVVNCRPTFCSEPTFVLSTTNVAEPSEVRDLEYTIEEDVRVHLSWKRPEHPNGPIDGYSIAVFDKDDKEGTLYDVGGHLNETTIDLKYQFTIFNISVKAYNEDKDRNETIGGSSSEVEFETLGDGPMPPRPKFGTVTDERVHIYWEMPKDPRYNITDFNVSVSHKNAFMTKERNFSIISLEPWTDYDVNISSCTNATDCGQKQSGHFKTDVGEPSEPMDLKVGSAGLQWILVEWKQPKVHNGPLSGYNITLNKDEGEVQDVTTKLSYNLTGLAAGTAYEVSVYAFNDGMEMRKRGPVATLKASTESEKSSTTVILLAVFIPLILLLLVAAFFLYKRYQKKTGDRTPLTTAEEH